MTYYEVVPEEQAAGAAGVEAAPQAAAFQEIAAADIAGRLAELTAALVALRQEMRAADERAAGRERIIERLHEDNQQLRTGERRLVLMPVLTDLQRLRNDLLRQAATAPADRAAERMAALLDSYAHSVELTLERGGVVVIRPAAGDAFDSSRHRPSGVAEAPEPGADGRVAEVLADGYQDAVTGRALTPATVLVYRWTEFNPASPTEESHV
jgi:molecular chaperone GrpE